MDEHICPWWLAYTFDNVFRRLIHSPRKIFGPYVREGMTVADLGCGMGWSAIALAKLVGEPGHVIAVDVQEKMLAVVTKRARRAGVAGRIRTVRCTFDSIGFDETVDFAVAFWVVHEVRDAGAFLRQVHARLKRDGKLLIVEPAFHVSKRAFEEMIETAKEVGLAERERTWIMHSRGVVLGEGCRL